MFEVTDAELKHQFALTKAAGWIEYFKDAGYGTTPDILMGIASRETNIRQILGDGRHGHGMMQIDDRSFPEWCRSGKWRDPKESIRMGAFVLRSFYNSAQSKKVPERDQWRVAVASYNAGKHAVSDYFEHGNPDLRTTGHNYSADVMHRAAIFKALLEEDDVAMGAAR